MKILTLEQIKEALPTVDLMHEIEAGFVAYSKGKAVVPPVGELVMQDPPGDVHIKYGYLSGDDYYVIKIASGFYNNPAMGLPSSNGLMLLFNQKNGELCAALLDEGHLTDVRTAVAGAIAAKYLAPSKLTRIGIIGTGIQARLQLQYLATVTSCRDVIVCGRDQQKLDAYCKDMSAHGFSVKFTFDAADLLRDCNLVVTTTPAFEPILEWRDSLDHGLHITAVGSDTAEKQELDLEFMKSADLIVADSISQCLTRGEIHHALKNAVIQENQIVELGDVIAGTSETRTSDEQLTIADLTGVAVQDIQISKAIFESIGST
ncbi:MAG: ornithine cyclodeaminase family protein [Woeseiaceae bacterium]